MAKNGKQRAPNSGTFKPGDPRAGRPKGIPNKATIEIREAARRLLAEPEYQESLKRRLIAGDAPHMETLLHHYAHGKPTDKVEISGVDGGPIRTGLLIEVVEASASGASD